MEYLMLQLNRPSDAVYFPGMYVTGRVIVVTDKPKDYKIIEVRLVGYGEVYWTEKHGNVRRIFSSNEIYLDTSQKVWSKRAHGGSLFPVGNHTFPFSLQLHGDDLPPSFESKIGKIRYTLTSRIVKSGFFALDKTREARLTVASVVDINTPILLQPKTMEVQKSLCCWCCASGPIVITARIPRSGYCAVTDAIPLEVVIENGSNRNIHMVASLHRKIKYTANNNYCYDAHKIKSVVSHRIHAHSSMTWLPILSIPVTVPTLMLTSCEIIDIYYCLRITASVPYTWAINPTKATISFPIFIGNLPLHSLSDE